VIEVVGVRFKKAGKIYYFDPGDHQTQVGDHVIVETVRGTELGEVVIGPRMVGEQEVTQPLKKVVRPATEEDLHQAEDNRAYETEAYGIARECIEALDLEMKLVGVECAFDRSKLVFFFTADQRVDFRELVKVLAARLHTRIELRQVGVRDEAKMLGGVGVCGRCLCCSSWIGEFSPVSIRHAKEQELSMNPGKISGVCGRLKCCLRYEAEAYKDARSRQPKLGDAISLSDGEARIVAVSLLRENATLQLPEGGRVTVNWDQLKEGQLTLPVTNPPEQPTDDNDMPGDPRTGPDGAASSDDQSKEESPASARQTKKSRGKAKSSGKRRRYRKRKPKRKSDAAGSGSRGEG
jgi:cell fate regulator YaaT (PSP1 superfamily)